jgi:hypothetical protein
MAETYPDDRFSVLQVEFEKLSKRLKETSDLPGRQAILNEAHQIIKKMHVLIQAHEVDFKRSKPAI